VPQVKPLRLPVWHELPVQVDVPLGPNTVLKISVHVTAPPLVLDVDEALVVATLLDVPAPAPVVEWLLEPVVAPVVAPAPWPVVAAPGPVVPLVVAVVAPPFPPFPPGGGGLPPGSQNDSSAPPAEHAWIAAAPSRMIAATLLRMAGRRSFLGGEIDMASSATPVVRSKTGDPVINTVRRCVAEEIARLATFRAEHN
jgi:hypothetical protein